MKITNKYIKNSVTASTYLLSHYEKDQIKCTFDIGDVVNSPFGKALITELNKETGQCKIFPFKKIYIIKRPTKAQLVIALSITYHWYSIGFNGCLLLAPNGKIRQSGSDELYYVLNKYFLKKYPHRSLEHAMSKIWYWYNKHEYSSISVSHQITLKLANLVYKHWNEIQHLLFLCTSNFEDRPKWIENI